MSGHIDHIQRGEDANLMFEMTLPVHVHIENTTRLGDVFEITESRLQDALNRHPELEGKVSITTGRDGVGFAEAMGRANVLVGWKFKREDLAKVAPNLRWIHLQGAGVNHLLPLNWVPPGVVLTNSRGVHGERASEYLMMGVLALNNRLPEMITNQRVSRWEKLHSATIRGKTILIYGVGHVGGDTAAMAKKFGLHVLGVRRTGAPHEHVDEMYRPEDLKTLLPQADFIVITAPHTPSTEHVIDDEAFGLMKQGAGFINYSRANIVDYNALSRALDAGKVSAILDVFYEEPLPKASPLWRLPNLIITPHSSSNDPEHHADRTLDVLFDNLIRFVRGSSLKNIVDLEQQY